MKTNASVLGIGGLAIILGLVYFMPATPDEPRPAPAVAEPNPFAFVRSMDGTMPDGDLRQGAGGLVVDAELGHLFDYYLAGLGERDLAAITGEIERELARRLEPGAAAQAKRLLASYLAYKRALAGLERDLPASADVAKAARSRLDAMQQLRRSYFSEAEIAGLFEARDAYDADAIARLRISQDARLSAAERQEKLAALAERMPRALRDDMEAPGKVMRTEESARAMRSQGAGDDAIYRMRATAISPDAARRLADLDHEEAAWQGRIDGYLQLRKQLLDGQPGQHDEARRQALQQLRQAHFTQDEQRRLGAYE